MRLCNSRTPKECLVCYQMSQRSGGMPCVLSNVTTFRRNNLIGWFEKTFDYINRVKLTLPLLVYDGTWTHSPPLVAMHPLDRSCVIIRIFLKLHATFPNSGIWARSMHRWYARVEHKELWAIIVILLSTNVLFDSAVLLDEVARTNLTWPRSWDWFHRHTCNLFRIMVAGGHLFLQLQLNRIWLRQILVEG